MQKKPVMNQLHKLVQMAHINDASNKNSTTVAAVVQSRLAMSSFIA